MQLNLGNFIGYLSHILILFSMSIFLLTMESHTLYRWLRERLLFVNKAQLNTIDSNIIYETKAVVLQIKFIHLYNNINVPHWTVATSPVPIFYVFS